MENFKFEEYRQPWETGPHWELKREFMEMYQNDFSVDRLLCLAQAYSNIELLHCSYPDPVMLQIHELSKPLQGCKRFREEKLAKNDEPELQARSGKRTALDDLKKPFKFIKFYSVGKQSTQEEYNLTAGDNIPMVASNPPIPLNDNLKASTPSSSTTTPLSPSLNDPSCIKIASSLEPSPSLESSGFSSIGIKGPSVSIEPDCNTTNDNFLLSLARSPDFEFIKKMALVKQRLKIKIKSPVKEIEHIVKQINLSNLVRYKFITSPLQKNILLCEFYIGHTLISVGRDIGERPSRENAAYFALNILGHGYNLPIKTLTDLKYTSNEVELSFFQKFTEVATKEFSLGVTPQSKIGTASSLLKCQPDVSYFEIGDDHNSPLHNRTYCISLVIKKVLICTGSGTSKSKAKLCAASQGIVILARFFNILLVPKVDDKKALDISNDECIEQNRTLPAESTNSIVESTKHSRTEVCESKEATATSKYDINSQASKIPDTSNFSVTEVEKRIAPFIPPKPITINYRLLNNSLGKKLALFDAVAIMPKSQQNPQAMLHYSCQFCKRSVKYEMLDSASISEGPLFRFKIILDGESIGLGEGASKGEAKSAATTNAIQSLQKHFYTIKIKNELDEGFVINRSQILTADVATNAVSDSNIGCRMLKMMGWTGGGIGKTGGIIEPIKASEHRFHQGLGFSNNQGETREFYQKIETLLKEFSQTETTSDLIFATDFTKDERKAIHRVVCQLGLVGTSRGKNANRQLYVRHKLTITDLLHQLVRAGGRTYKYELIDMSS